MADQADFDIWIGNNAPVTFRFKNKTTGADLDLTGYVFVMRALAGGEQIYRVQASPTGGSVAFAWTTVQTRKVPLGGLTQYELEARKDGVETTWLYGTITGRGGINDDLA